LERRWSRDGRQEVRTEIGCLEGQKEATEKERKKQQ